MRTLTMLTTLTCALAVNGACVEGAEDPLKQHFLDEYPKAYAAWTRLMSSVEGEITCRTVEARTSKSEDMDGDASTEHSVNYSFKYRHPDFGLVVSSEHHQESLEQRVEGLNPKYSFILIRTDANSQYSIRSLEFRTSGKRPAGLPAASLLYFPFGTRVLSLKSVGQRQFLIQSVKKIAHSDGKNLLRVAFEVGGSGEIPKALPKNAKVLSGEGELVLSPDEKWVLYGYEFRKRSGFNPGLYQGTVEYEGRLGDFPAPKRAARKEFAADGKLVKREEYEFRSLRTAGFTDSEFTLSAFGVPEAVANPPATGSQRNSLGYWYLAIAVFTLLTGVVLKIITQRMGAGPKA